MGSASSDLVSLVALKAFASRSLGSHPILRSVILSEKDHVTREELLAKIETWHRIFDLETRPYPH